MIIVNIHNVAWKKNYTQKDAKEKTGLSNQTISNLWKIEHRNYNLATIESIAKFLDCKALDLLEEVSD